MMTYTDHFFIGLIDFFIWAKWLVILAMILTLADLKFGIAAAHFRKENVKKSKAVRRTIEKIRGYIVWIVIAYTFGQAFGTPFGVDMLPILMLIIIYGVELESIYANYFASKGKSVKVNILKFFGNKADMIKIEDKEEGEADNGKS